MKSLLASAAMLLALSSSAFALDDCSGQPADQVECLRRNQFDLQKQLEELREQMKPAEKPQIEAAPKPAAVVPAAGWIKDDRGCKVWNGWPGPEETITWSGPCRGGIANGQGALIWYWSGKPHSTFVGVLRDGHYHRGVQVWSTGNRYEGSYENDRAEGRGTYRTASGEVYSGRWVKGCFRDGPRRASIGTPIDACMN